MRAIRPLCALALLAGTFAIHSQTFTASVLGTVTDASGAAIPTATVTATNVATNLRTEARSDATGRYLLSQLISATNVAGLFNSRGLANNNGTSGKISGDVHDRLNQYFNTSVFSQPAAFTFGNTSVTSPDLRSPLVRNWDLSIFKDFVVKEGLRLQFRTEAFNAVNAVRFGSPDTNRANTTFGTVSTQANSPRQIQFGLKVLF